MNENYIPEEYTPISMWGYFGYSLLFSIPIVGLICIIVFSFGGSRNINLRNFARSYFCWLIIGLIICAFLLLFGGMAAVTAFLSQVFIRTWSFDSCVINMKGVSQWVALFLFIAVLYKVALTWIHDPGVCRVKTYEIYLLATRCDKWRRGTKY